VGLLGGGGGGGGWGGGGGGFVERGHSPPERREIAAIRPEGAPWRTCGEEKGRMRSIALRKATWIERFVHYFEEEKEKALGY